MNVEGSADQAALPFSDLIDVTRGRRSVVQGRPQSRKPPRRIETPILRALGNPNCVIFLDVETTGLSKYYDVITLVGWLYQGIYRVHLPDDDPEVLLDTLSNASALVTFNGKLFDLPFLTKTFPG